MILFISNSNFQESKSQFDMSSIFSMFFWRESGFLGIWFFFWSCVRWEVFFQQDNIKTKKTTWGLDYFFIFIKQHCDAILGTQLHFILNSCLCKQIILKIYKKKIQRFYQLLLLKSCATGVFLHTQCKRARLVRHVNNQEHEF